MITLKKALVTCCMMLVWLVTGVMLIGTTNWKGTLSILLSGVFLNILLAYYYGVLERQTVRLSKRT